MHKRMDARAYEMQPNHFALVVEQFELVNIFQKSLVSCNEVALRLMALMDDANPKDQFAEMVIVLRRKHAVEEGRT